MSTARFTGCLGKNFLKTCLKKWSLVSTIEGLEPTTWIYLALHLQILLGHTVCSKTSFVVCVAICCLIQLSRAFQRWWRRKTRRKEEINFSDAHFVICPFLRTCVNFLEFVAVEGKGSWKSSKRSHIFSDYEFWLTSYSTKLWRGSGFRYYCCPREQRHKN